MNSLSTTMRKFLLLVSSIILFAFCACDDTSGPVNRDMGKPSSDVHFVFSDGAGDASSPDRSVFDGALGETRPGDAAIGDTIHKDTSLSDTTPGDAQVHDAASPDLPVSEFCPECVQIRLGRPLISRGPVGDELDTSFSVIPLGNGTWRGFSANGSTYAIDGQEMWSMGGTRTLVLSPGVAGSDAECGQWINDVKLAGNTVRGFVHWERGCNYSLGQTHKSMAYATSVDNGLSWSVQGKIISGTDSPTAGLNTGEGDCSVVDGTDGYYYIYCLRTSDYQTIAARAPKTNPGPGQWLKYYQGAWSQPGLGGQADGLGFIGPGAGRWTSQGQMLSIVPDKWLGGLKLSFAGDKVTFLPLAEPLIFLDDVNWLRPAPTELIAYVSLLNPSDGSKQLDGHFLLAYIHLQPGDDFSQRYLVFQDVWIQHGSSPIKPQVGVALSRWYNAALQDRWSTNGPVPGNYTSYLFEGTFGYLMTKAHPTLPTTKLEDCVSSWPGHPDHLLTQDGQCVGAGYTRLRTAGWVFASQQPGTLPLYRCYNAQEQHHFASNAADCEGLGAMEWLLGYTLAQ